MDVLLNGCESVKKCRCFLTEDEDLIG